MVGERPPVGYTSEVHTSLLEPLLLFQQVPYWPGIVNFLVTALITVSYQWWTFPLVGVLVHGGMMLLTHGDPDRIRILVRLLWRYRRYYGTR